jgi:SM-20-related protein
MPSQERNDPALSGPVPLPGSLPPHDVPSWASRILISHGFGWLDDFVSPDQARELRSIADRGLAAGDFHVAGIGRGEVNLEIRSDFICWLDPDETLGPVGEVLGRYRSLLPAINSTCFLGLKSLEPMLAVYPPGAHYLRHRDRFREKPHRVVSIVLYLNEQWSERDGGELVLFPENAGEVVIHPAPGRLAIFLSELEHEVRPTEVARYSLTTWLLDRPVIG